jgi:hypothetical protein
MKGSGYLRIIQNPCLLESYCRYGYRGTWHLITAGSGIQSRAAQQLIFTMKEF